MRSRLRKPLIPALAALLALAILAEIRYSRQVNLTSDRATPAPTAISTITTSSSPAPVPLPAAVSSATPVPTVAQPPDQEAMLEIDRVNLMLRDYRTIAGENPVGTNAEIMAAVMGANPKQAKLGPPEGMELNEKGELVDRWGTPYFFHQISRDRMEIHSAGPDKILWTEDDPIVR